MQLHILVLFRGYASLISSSEKSFSSLFSMTPSLCRLREAPSHLSCDTVFPIPCCQTLAVLPPTKKIEGSARDDDTRRMRFPHTLSLHDARDIHSLHCHFERSREILLALCSFLLLSQKFSPFPLSRIGRYTSMQERSRASLGMTLREYRSLTLPIYFPCNNDTREAPSTFAALLFFMRRTTPLNPTT